jgi:hypothetical protein
MIITDLRALPLVWNKIGSIKDYGPVANFSNAPMAVMVNDCYGLFYPCATYNNPAQSAGAFLRLFDGYGKSCTYQTSDFRANNVTMDGFANPNAVFQTGNTFVYSFNDGTTWKWTIPTSFSDGEVYISTPSLLSSKHPCADNFTPNEVIFVSQQDLICYEWIQDFADDSNYWASVYDSLGNPKGGGYIGNAKPDLFNRVVTNLPPFVDTGSLFYKNGFNFFLNMTGSNPFQVYGFNQPYLFGNPGELICGGTGNPNVYVGAIQQYQVYPNRDFGIPAFNGNVFRPALGATNINGAFIIPDFPHTDFIGRDFYVMLPMQVGADNRDGAVGYHSTKKHLYSFVALNPTGTKYVGDLYVASLDLSSYGPPPLLNRAVYKGLANYHRAVSPSGSFQA